MGRLADGPLRTVVIGGGPGGLLGATLIKQRHPHHEVVVYERNPHDATFGFGVVFSEGTMGGLAAVDPQIHEAMEAAAVHWTDIEVRRRGETIRCGGHGFAAIARRTVLTMLQDVARDAGVELHFEHEATAADWSEADLVLASDGVNSTLRDIHAETFRPRFEVGRAKFIWFATPQPFDALTFLFEENEHGQWGVHAYPFEDGTSTFIVEADEATWRRAGLDAAGDLAPGESDMRSMSYVEDLFAGYLGGHGLLGNNSRWTEFRTLRCGAWSAGNVALVGDSAHTAHFSVGSGTKMAMEDAVALAGAVDDADTVEAALSAYERERRPKVEHIQRAARPSLAWWERFDRLADRSTEQFAFHFLSRSPQVTRDVLTRRDRRFVRRVEQWAAPALGYDPSDGALAAPFELGALRLPSRLVAGPVAAEPDLVPALAGLARGGAGAVIADGCAKADAIRGRCLIGRTLDASAAADDVRAAVSDGCQILQMPLDAPGVEAWPADLPLLAVVGASGDGHRQDNLVDSLARLEGERLVVATVVPSPDSDDPIVDQLLLCDRIKQETTVPVCLAGTVGTSDQAITALLAGRADLVQGLPSLVSERWNTVPSSVPVGA